MLTQNIEKLDLENERIAFLYDNPVLCKNIMKILQKKTLW